MYSIGTAAGRTDFLARLNAFLTQGSAFGVSTPGRGKLTGYRGGASSRAERITITATTPTSFRVEGRLSGFLGVAALGVPFDSAQVAFTVEVGSAAPVAGDVISVQTAPPWVALRASPATGYVWQAPGNDGAQAIFVGAIQGSSSNFVQLNGFTGYTAANTFATQPGRPTFNVFPAGLALSAGSIDYWFVADGRRVIIIAKPAAGVYQSAYLGLANTFVDPSVYPYPLVIGATALDNVANTDTSYKNTAFVRSTYEQLMLRSPPGYPIRADGWAAYATDGIGSGGCSIWPHFNGSSSSSMHNVSLNLDGSRQFFPVLLRCGTDKHLMAQLAGVHCVGGGGLTAQTLLDFGGLAHLVVPNVNRTTAADFFTVALD